MRRALDLAVAAAGLVLLGPVLVMIAVALRVSQGRPVLFTELRAGRNAKPFTLVKFRTMTDGRDERGAFLPDDERLTGIGRWLRSTSLDELPELWNVLRGDMGLVGPRPLPVRYLPRYTTGERRRHEVRPGITGWAQVNGRNAVGWDERLAMDVWYVDHRSALLDLRILARTIGLVVRRRDVGPAGTATMPELRPHLMSTGDRP